MAIKPPAPPAPPVKPAMAGGPPKPAAPAFVPPKPSRPEAAAEGAPVVSKPKKETARIQMPPPEPVQLPKATVKMQQTQPMSAPPKAAVTRADKQDVKAARPAPAPRGGDVGLPFSIAALIGALAAFAMQLVTYLS